MNESPLEQLRHRALELGFSAVGIVPARKPRTIDHLYQWLDEGRNAGMAFFQNRRDAYADPGATLPGAKTIIVFAWPYLTQKPYNPFEDLSEESDGTADQTEAGQEALTGRVAAYATGKDYHQTIRERLDILIDIHRELFPRATCRAVTDTAPILEKDAAVSAGLGFIGRNTLLYCGKDGSRVCLGEMLSTVPPEQFTHEHFTPEQFTHEQAVPVQSPEPVLIDRFTHCGECRRCLDACPTQALSDRGLDARKCLNYWTIEHRGELPPEIRFALGDRLYGCDECQTACPRNPVVTPVRWPLKPILALDEEQFRRRFKTTSVYRCKLTGLQRNARAVLENISLENNSKE